MHTLLQDLRYGIRTLARKPSFTLAALFTLMLGIGATTAIFTVVDAVLLRPLPFTNPDRLVEIWNSAPQRKISYPGLTFDTLDQWRSSADFLDGFEGYQPVSLTLTGAPEPKLVQGTYVSGGLMAFLGARPRIGRLLLPDDGKPGQDHVIVLSDALWREVSGSDPAILGKSIILNKEEYFVAGVMPPDFRFPQPSGAFWIPFSLTHDSVVSKKLRPWIITRVKTGVSLERAQKRLDAISQRLQQERPRPAGWMTTLMSLDGKRASRQTRRNLLILLGAVVFVLAISCVNVGNMLLSHSITREKELAVRAALGAGRGRILRQLLTESVLLSVSGGSLGVLLASWGVSVIAHSIPREINFFSTNPVSLDHRVLFFSLGVSGLTGVLFGLLPSLKASRINLNDSLAAGGRSESGAMATRRLRNVLVVAQVALSFTLLIGAGLMIKSLRRLSNVTNGFDRDNLVVLSLELPRAKYSAGTQQAAFFEQVSERLAALPGIRSATVAGGPPLGNGGITFGDLEAEGHQATEADKGLVVPVTEVVSNYFQVLRIPLLQGRLFSEEDGRGSDNPTIINQSMARRYWPNDSPIGRRFRVGDSPRDWRTVIGVVGDVKAFDIDDRPEQLELYFPMPATAASEMRSLIVRTTGDPLKSVPAIKSAIWSVDQDQVIRQVATIDDLLKESLAGPRFYVLLMGIFACVALLLSAIGVYGVINYAVSLRTREIGIRMALGARPYDVLKTVVGQGLLFVGLGIVLGIGGAAALTHLMTGFLYEVRPTDAATFVITLAIYLGVAFAASYVPARRAVSVDPMIALRYE